MEIMGIIWQVAWKKWVIASDFSNDQKSVGIVLKESSQNNFKEKPSRRND